jgi:hypothetical protein
MRSKILLLSLFSLLFVGAWTLRPIATTWEYKVVSLKVDSKIEAKLNEFGSQGWELVSYSDYISNGTGSDAGIYHFKRAK